MQQFPLTLNDCELGNGTLSHNCPQMELLQKIDLKHPAEEAIGIM